MLTALAGFTVMLVGFFLGVPLGIVLFTVGFFGFALIHPAGLPAAAGDGGTANPRPDARFPILGPAAVHPDRQLRQSRQSLRRSLRGSASLARSSPRRLGARDHRRLRRLRLGLSFLDRHRRDDGARRRAVDATLSLCRLVQHRHGRRRRRARHAGAAERRAHRLRAADRRPTSRNCSSPRSARCSPRSSFISSSSGS